ncbi:MAG: L,D-transpeptidase family protein [Gemmatimonadaceae bacterium]|nr:L,D-transpeptidase family protein [Gemmatimonadaceae bacterium]
MTCGLAGALLLLALPARASAQSTTGATAATVTSATVTSATVTADSAATALIRAALASGRLAGARWPRLGDVREDLSQLYDSAAWRPLWLRDGQPTATAMGAVRYLTLVETVGLHAEDYDAARLDSLAKALVERRGAPSHAPRFEALLSVAVARVLAALQWGRVNPRDVHEEFRIPRFDYDVADAMREMADGTDPTAIFNAAEPPLLHYRLLKAQLARQRELARDSTSLAPRKRMAERITKIELSLERWRWLPHSFPGRVLIVNIPEFRLHVFDRLTPDSTDLFSMDVVVGQAFDHRTPIFMNELRVLHFSPYWEVPTSIARKEIRPPALRAPSYLARHHYVLLGSGDRVVPATAANIAAIGTSVRVRQLPGRDNALGRVKFLFPNPHNVYMHDTPVQQAFARARRDISHGCIRLSQPVELARWVLRDRPEWTQEALDSAMTRSTPLEVPVTEHIPVLILYGTAIAERNGDMRFYADIYGHDRQLAALLARGYPYPR